MSRFMDEFKQFIARGNVMDMAVGVIVGGAFTSVVTSLTDDIINPLITFLTGGGAEVSGLVVPGTSIDFGAFISAIINFFITALIVFILVRGMNTLHDLTTHEAPKAAPVVCPHCLEEVKEGATRCPHCGGEIPGGAHS
ncbi:MAG: large conductance mechanosensitive channel protein MscL [Atopobiaceae bacterium]|jgi:large conductance mechanosensitive channel|nr:large conductance mechanosensitive channel protein MscL [Atopobiaceae bacterium]MCH4120384.1 large conductance mechanosensitive channel protein MscL [Atopobiaceae bacterium]MCI1389800.1 large conductance mechanosensitive channel protein MscL [Atopobiaceae bacterium]MCI1431938.1 large conductance mechanosensitive channel protein MscL [Atopobiaceae bacterium]MCI1470374.1 large conductance mechanosensitive channel protein MscL [Atopobiaceae bacterium]